MSRINDLLRQVANTDPQLAKDLQRETDALAARRAFGLNFERHTPEAVELPGRPARKNDKVRILPDRGETPKKADERLFNVTKTYTEDGVKWADVAAMNDPEEGWSVAVEDLIVVAEFRDPIYPGLVSTGKVERGGDKPFHTVINSENYHALQALLFTHRGNVDAIYIDPPYNTGARDWKYNNDYVESDDHYRHSKWLAMMERRLLLAKELLNPDDSVLIVTIDEREGHRLALLLEQVFTEARIQMVSSVINFASVSKNDSFGRTDEYIFFVMVGEAGPRALPLPADWSLSGRQRQQVKFGWELLNRRGSNARRTDRPNMFFPVFVANMDGGPRVVEVGDAYYGSDYHSVQAPSGALAVWPIRSDGSEGRWKISADALRDLLSDGFVRINRWSGATTSIYYAPRGQREKIEDGLFRITGRRPDGSVDIDESGYAPTFVPGTAWRLPAHNATEHGTNLLRALMPDRRFPFPKSLYAVEDALRFFVKDKPEAVIADFFAGSGTTAHAMLRLNRQDHGQRRCISISNNEVSAEEQKGLRHSRLRPGDPEWEAHGVCDYITKPRIEAAITGTTPGGDPIKGDYKFTDESPMADGFEENVEFFTLTYESAMRVSSHREFAKIAPFLWLRAGSRGRRIDDISTGWDVADTYGVIANLDLSETFVKAVEAQDRLTHAFIVTDEDRLFEAMVRQLPEQVEPVRLYSSYLRNFEIEAGRAAR